METYSFQKDKYVLENHKQFSKINLILVILSIIAFFIIVFLLVKIFTKSKRISVPCPSVQSFCQSKNEVFEKGKAVGLGFMLNTGTPVYAIADGEVTVRSVTVRVNGNLAHYKKITLKSSNNEFIAEYFFEKGSAKNSSVKKGDLIFTIESDQPISFYKDYNFVFKLFDQQLDPVLATEIDFL